ncbi:MAG: capsule assembly Wzi family protein [Fibrobacter sp.]|nr:capsule assembly Wzi family protein [Fibrobacter sp.]
MQKLMWKRYGLVLTTVALLVGSSSAESDFSKANKYDLSYEALIRKNEAMGDLSKPYWFSKPDEFFSDKHALKFTAKNQELGVDVDALLGFEQYKEHNFFWGFSGDVSYISKYLKAFISADVYTTDDNFAYPVQSVKYERFIKKDAAAPIDGAVDFRFNLPQAYLEAEFKSIKLAVGKMKLRWGPGYKGTLALSGTAYSPFYFYNLNFKFGNIVNAAAFLCGYDDETFYKNELNFPGDITVKKINMSLRDNLPRYGAGQRLDLRIGKHVQLGFYEIVDFFGSNELIRFANPLQVYYLSNESSGTNNANLMGGMDFNVMVDRFRLYGEFLNDDITVFENSGNPNKYAYQLGLIFYGKNPLVETGFEYTHVTRYVYGHSRVLSRHSFWGQSMGWPWGNEMDLFNIHAVFNLPYNLKAKTEVSYWIQGIGKVEDDWYADGSPNLDHAAYWPRDSKECVSAVLAAEYNPLNWITLNFYYEPVFEKNKVSHGIYTYLRVGIPGKGRVFSVSD